MTLEEFISEKRAEVEAFKLRWLEAHHKAPEMYPLEMPEEDSGLWDEQFHDFDPQGGPFEIPEEE
ncbi:hypothetical protein PXK56_17815 [Phaeobacter gallaeciensis]|uniref:hypothetical protein n=1 Tax=Phaeobacter gallaeciensis TaxID=60890 RepID=UPI002380A4B7|nr:hypothetical protein [Phaeobacter gallaeciensis]MDE4297046.1 hypothetical protein [Phaeobacter gallaeciensis]